MTNNVIWRTAIRSGFILSVLMTTYSCGSNTDRTTKSHNLKFVQCDPNVSVSVTTGGVSSADDDAIFVCAGNNVQWFTDVPNFMFTVVFDPATNPGNLFDSSQPQLPSKPDPSHTHQYITDVQVVSKKAIKFKDYSYSIQPPDKTAKPVAASDPHVIPM